MMLGCLLAAVSYIPIYKAMQPAAGSNVVTASRSEPGHRRDHLTPQTIVNGVQQPASEVLPYTNFAALSAHRLPGN